MANYEITDKANKQQHEVLHDCVKMQHSIEIYTTGNKNIRKTWRSWKELATFVVTMYSKEDNVYLTDDQIFVLAQNLSDFIFMVSDQPR